MQSIPNASDILTAVIDATPDAIFVKDLDGCYVLVNQAAARFVGRTPAEVIGKNDLELYPEETARRFIEDDKAVLLGGAPMSFEGVASSSSGTQAYLVTKGVYRDKAGKILGIYGISHDITELRAAQDSLEQTRAALFRSQKMEAVGQLTGGIAHDFNNILMVILGNLELLKLRLPEGDDHAVELIDETLRATRHGQDLTGDLLASHFVKKYASPPDLPPRRRSCPRFCPVKLPRAPGGEASDRARMDRLPTERHHRRRQRVQARARALPERAGRFDRRGLRRHA